MTGYGAFFDHEATSSGADEIAALTGRDASPIYAEHRSSPALFDRTITAPPRPQHCLWPCHLHDHTGDPDYQPPVDPAEVAE